MNITAPELAQTVQVFARNLLPFFRTSFHADGTKDVTWTAPRQNDHNPIEHIDSLLIEERPARTLLMRDVLTAFIGMPPDRILHLTHVQRQSDWAHVQAWWNALSPHGRSAALEAAHDYRAAKPARWAYRKSTHDPTEANLIDAYSLAFYEFASAFVSLVRDLAKHEIANADAAAAP